MSKINDKKNLAFEAHEVKHTGAYRVKDPEHSMLDNTIMRLEKQEWLSYNSFFAVVFFAIGSLYAATLYYFKGNEEIVSFYFDRSIIAFLIIYISYVIGSSIKYYYNTGLSRKEDISNKLREQEKEIYVRIRNHLSKDLKIESNANTANPNNTEAITQ